MSEMEEDYPSDTGDDRFSAVGESDGHLQIHRNCGGIAVWENHLMFNNANPDRTAADGNTYLVRLQEKTRPVGSL